MYRNVLRLFWASILAGMVACAPARTVVPPAESRDLREVLAARRAVGSIEARLAVLFERQDSEMRGDAALTVARNGDLSLRVYSLGFLAMELSSCDGVATSAPPIDARRRAMLARGLRDCLFWWDMEEPDITDAGTQYVLLTRDRELRLDKRTLLPDLQRIWFDDGSEVTITYSEPAENGGIWYPSKIRIELRRYTVTLEIREMTFSG